MNPNINRISNIMTTFAFVSISSRLIAETKIVFHLSVFSLLLQVVNTAKRPLRG